MIGVPITSKMINAEKRRRAALNDVHNLAALGMVRIQELLTAREAEGKTLTPEELRDLAERYTRTGKSLNIPKGCRYEQI